MVRALASLLMLGAAFYVIVAAVVWLLQSRLVFYPNEPGRELAATPAEIGLSFESVEFQARDGVSLHGWYVPAPGARFTILFCHGNAGNISHRLETLALLHRLGFSVFIFDYRGYGLSDGSPTEKGTYDDALGAWQHLVDRGVRPDQVIIHGRSLGGAIAAWLATQVAPAGLILESTFSSIAQMARTAFPWLPPGLNRIHYDTASRIQSISAPIMIMHSREDSVIGFSHGQQLQAAALEGSRFVELRGNHNETVQASGERYAVALRDFADSLPGAGYTGGAGKTGH